MNEDDLWKEISRLRERVVKLETIIEEKDKGSSRKTAITAAIVGGIVSAIITPIILMIQIVFNI